MKIGKAQLGWPLESALAPFFMYIRASDDDDSSTFTFHFVHATTNNIA